MFDHPLGQHLVKFSLDDLVVFICSNSEPVPRDETWGSCSVQWSMSHLVRHEVVER